MCYQWACEFQGLIKGDVLIGLWKCTPQTQMNQNGQAMDEKIDKIKDS